MIPEAAVSIALAALPDEACRRVGFDDMRVALDAAMAHTLAEAWKEGVIVGAQIQIEHELGRRLTIPNPYRTAK